MLFQRAEFYEHSTLRRRGHYDNGESLGSVPVEDYNRQGILEVIKDPSRYNTYPVLTFEPEILEGDFITGDVPLLFSDFGSGEGVLSVVVPVSSQYALFYSSVHCEFCMSSEDVCKEINSRIYDLSGTIAGSSRALLESVVAELALQGNTA